jgi:hypothetical protein
MTNLMTVSVVIVSDLRLLDTWACIQTSWQKLQNMLIGGSLRLGPIITKLRIISAFVLPASLRVCELA